MKVLFINGSSNKNGCTFRALKEIETVLNKDKIETEIVQLGSDAVRDCIGCKSCAKNGNMIESGGADVPPDSFPGGENDEHAAI